MSAMTDGAEATPAAPRAARSALFWAVLTAAIVTLPCFVSGFSNDDLSQRLVLERRVPNYELGPFELYDFTPPRFAAPALIDRGIFPWFASPELSLRFLRPVSSLSLAVDHWLFGRNAALSHLQSWLWMVVLAAAAGSLYQRWFTRRAALASALVFALSTVHGTPTAWLASRHTLLAAALSALALWAWVRHREQGQARFARVAWLCLAGALLASESGLVGVALLASYELGTRAPGRRLSGAAPFALLGLAYLGAYVALGYGAKGSSFYVSPFSAPLDYFASALWSVPALVAELLLALPSLVASFLPATRGLYILAALAAAAALAAILSGARERLTPRARQSLRWLAAWTFVGLFGLIGAPVAGRVLPLPAFGAAALVGNAIVIVWERLRPPPSSAPAMARASRGWWAALVPLVVLHFVLSPLLRVGQAVQVRYSAEAQRRLAEQADVGACERSGSLYLLTGADPTLALYTAAALSFYTPTKAGSERLRVLSMAAQPVVLSRPEPRVLALEVFDRPRRENPFERLYRPATDPLLTGAHVELPELSAHVERADSGLFQRARFEFRRELAGDAACLLAWRGGRLEAVALPTVGESVTLAHEPGPLGL